MRVLLVKLSSLGDVVHTLPAAMDIAAMCPGVQIDWVVEPAFAGLVQQCPCVSQVIEMDLRRWRKNPWSSDTLAAWRDFRRRLQAQTYDRVIDLQGLTKSALVSRLAHVAPGGLRIAMAHATDGSSYERPTRWVADRCVSVRRHIHAVDRAREVCALALGYTVPPVCQPGLDALRHPAEPSTPEVVCVHGTSRDDKLWPETHWVALGRRLLDLGLIPVFVHGSDLERSRSERLSHALPGSRVAPPGGLSELLNRMALSRGVIGVDSGPSHMAVALGLPHVQIYNFDTAWRTGPQHRIHQLSVVCAPTPGVEQVWQAWLQVSAAVQP